MKAKKVNKIARGRMARSLVFRGSQEKTVGGLTKDTLMKNSNDKIVSKTSSARAHKRFRAERRAHAEGCEDTHGEQS